MLKTKASVCMIVQDRMVKGGIAAVLSGYYGSCLEKDYDITYIESYCDGGKWTKLRKAISGYRQFARLLRTSRPDLVHIHSSFGPSFFRKLPFIHMASQAGIPIVNHIHGADFDSFYLHASAAKKGIIRRTYGRCNRLIALSDEWKDRLSLIVSPEKITVIRNYSVPHEEAVRERSGTPHPPTVLFLGELGKRKGCYDIPSVAALVAKEIPNVRFILCGAGAKEDEQAIRKLFREKGLTDRVEFPGWVRGEEKDRRLREADVFFLPSYQEGLPMSILDAMGYGLPVVSTKVGGIPELVRDGANGICCAPGDTVAMASALCEMLQNNDLRLAYGAESLRIVREEFSLDTHLRAVEAVYEEVLA